MLIESLSGVRGWDSALTENLIKSYALAFRETVRGNKILIGRDTRASGANIQSLLAEALRNSGANVVLLGICPTPTVQLAVEQQHAAGGIVITASHNPLPWNGLKFIGSDGLFLDGPQMLQLKNRRLEIGLTLDTYPSSTGTIREYSTVLEDHIQAVLRIPYIDPASIRSAAFKIVFDAVNGAGYEILPQLLSQLGSEVIRLNCAPDKPFPRSPEPLPENLGEVMEAVKKHHADLGLVVDPDADRLAIVSDEGKPISEEFTLVLAEKLVLSKSESTTKSVVTNLSTTLAVDDIAAQYGARIYRTAIGEINVAKKMREVGATVGGEGNGGVLLPEAHLGRDSLVATVLILQLLAEEKVALSQLMTQLPSYSMAKKKVALGDIDLAAAIPELKKLAAADEYNTEDGIKFSWRDRWVHLRPSNTEPIIRIYAEAPTKAEAEEIVAPFVRFFEGH